MTDTDTRIELLAEQVEKSNTMLAQFAASVTALLSGMPSGATAAPAPVARRRGRPPKAASVAPPAPVARQLSERAQQAATLVARAGRLTINDLAEQMGISRNLAHHYAWEAAKVGKFSMVKRPGPSGQGVMVMYAPTHAHFKDI